MEFNAEGAGAEELLREGRFGGHEYGASKAMQGLVVPVVLSGGGGSRLWPYSTKQTPKQFLPLVGDRTLYEQALDRVRDARSFTAPVVVGSMDHAEFCEAGLAAYGKEARVILEPIARNTAAAIIMAAIVVRDLHGEDAVLLVMPSDHVIDDVEEFHRAIRSGEAAARAGRLVTFGIRPSSADAGYGYLQTGNEVPGAPGVRDVARFVEKPQVDVAEAMVAGGDYLWNAGIFLFSASTLLDEAARTCPAIAEAASMAIAASQTDGIRLMPDADSLASCPSESIDYAVMELSSRVATVPMAPGWSDVGSWDALVEIIGNGRETGPVTAVDCENCYIRSEAVEIAALGLRDLIVVSAGSKLLILPRGRSQEVKGLLAAMDLKVA
ncbi:hypothetical protein GCM10022276_13840 [Sphingomonas limnosediminicola]|uniref:Mannose-1-phosphate guanylyltransferase n=2 Tax=Sphingomonas limnosediminicola TaxID=940133 RepID=A0ABP7L6U3_9SPHN